MATHLEFGMMPSGVQLNIPRGTVRHNDVCMKKATLIAAARIATGNPRLGWGAAQKWGRKRMRDLRREIAAHRNETVSGE